jgi:adenosine deaminase
MYQYSEAFIREVPKTDLHVHLDGSIRIPTLIDLAKSRGVKLPSYTEEGLRETVFKDRYSSLVEYLHGFGFTCAVLQDPEALERAAYELAYDNFEEGVRYIEVRFAPQLHVHDTLDVATVLRSVCQGMARARDEINRLEAIASGREPRFEFGIIACAMRMFTGGFSRYFRQFMTVHAFTPPDEIYALASAEMARAVVSLRNNEGLPIVGFDLAGQEAGYPAGDHVEAYNIIHKAFLNKTVHAGEAYGPESIFQAITDLHADRIGHGYHLFSPDRIQSPQIKNRDEYIQRLAQYIAERRVTLEVCLTSNLQTMPELTDIKQHNFRKMLDARLSVTLCTDNRTVSNTNVSREVSLALHNFDISPRHLKGLLIYGFKRSFYPGSYQEKRAYVRQVIDYYETVARKHGYLA